VCGVEIDRDFDRARYQVRNGQIVCAQCDAPKQLTLLGQPAARIVESRET